jgi:hypothetical protein
MKMNRRIKRACCMVLGVFLATTVMAFAQQKNPGTFADLMSRIKQDLKLNDEQVQHIAPIIKDLIDQLQALTHQDLSESALQSETTALFNDLTDNLSPYLTPEQMKLWETNNHLLAQGENSGNHSSPHQKSQGHASGSGEVILNDNNGVLESSVSGTGSPISQNSILVK